MPARTAFRSGTRVRRSARRTADSRAMAWLARAGLTARGVMYVLIGIIAVQIAVEGSRQQADRSGAVRLVAHTAFGTVALWLLVIGFAGMTLWRLSEAIRGSADPDARKASNRLANLARAVFYAVVTYGILKYALGVGQPSSSDNQSRDLTAAALKHHGGQWIVAIAGNHRRDRGLYTMYRAYKLKFLKRLRMGRPRRGPARSSRALARSAGWRAASSSRPSASSWLSRPRTRTRGRPRASTPRCARWRTRPSARCCSSSSRSASRRSGSTPGVRPGGTPCRWRRFLGPNAGPHRVPRGQPQSRW